MPTRNLNQDLAIHALRVEIKHLRAELRLLKHSIPHSNKINRTLRDISRLLSPFRDTAVRAKWLRRHGLPVPKEKNKPPPLAPLQTKVRSIRAGLEKSIPAKLNKRKKSSALAKSIKKLKQAGKCVKKHPDDDSFHEWRKRAKDFLFQMEYLGFSKDKNRKVYELTKILGRAQDASLIQNAHLPRSTRMIAKKEKERLQAKAWELAPMSTAIN